MSKLFSATIVGVFAMLANAGDAQACGGCGCAVTRAHAALPSCAGHSGTPAAAPGQNGHEGMAMPPSASTSANGRTTYRAYSYDPGAASAPAPRMPRTGPRGSTRLRADYKFRGMR
jgi:hypothetical protein